MSDSTDQTLPPDAARPGKLVVADATAQAESRVVLGFRAQDRRIITVLMSVLLLWLMVEWIVVANRRPDPLLLHRGSEFQGNFRVNVNESTWVEWMQLEGIGPALAQRIVADRSLKGRFSSIKDVGDNPAAAGNALMLTESRSSKSSFPRAASIPAGTRVQRRIEFAHPGNWYCDFSDC